AATASGPALRRTNPVARPPYRPTTPGHPLESATSAGRRPGRAQSGAGGRTLVPLRAPATGTARRRRSTAACEARPGPAVRDMPTTTLERTPRTASRPGARAAPPSTPPCAGPGAARDDAAAIATTTARVTAHLPPPAGRAPPPAAGPRGHGRSPPAGP